MIQHLMLVRANTGKAFLSKPAELKLVYPSSLLAQLPNNPTIANEVIKQSSSPVCYAHVKGMRKGFEDLNVS